MSDNDKQLIEVAKKGYTITVVDLIARGANVNYKNWFGDTALIVAVKNNKMNVIKELLKHTNIDVNIKNKDGSSALLLAAQNGHLTVVDSLVTNNATIDGNNHFGNTALTLAAQNGHLEIVNHLITNSADVNHRNHFGNTSLLLAAQNGHPEIVNILLDNGARINQWNNFGDTALLLASENGHINIVNTLLDKGAHVNHANHFGNISLLLAAQNGHINIVNTLLDKGAHVNHANESGDTALLLAIENNYMNIVDVLIEKNDALSGSNQFDDSTLLLTAQNKYPEIVDELLDKAVVVNYSNQFEKMPLLTVQNNDIKLVDSLLTHKSIINSKPKKYFNNKLLVETLYQVHNVFTQKLLTKGVNKKTLIKDNVGFLKNIIIDEEQIVNKKQDEEVDDANKDSWTSLHHAVYQDQGVVVEQLIDKGIDVNALTKDHCTALHFASHQGYSDIAQQLIAKGADVNALTKDHCTPLYFACINDEFITFNLLIDKGANWEIKNNEGQTVSQEIDLAIEILEEKIKNYKINSEHIQKTHEKAEGKTRHKRHEQVLKLGLTKIVDVGHLRDRATVKKLMDKDIKGTVEFINDNSPVLQWIDKLEKKMQNVILNKKFENGNSELAYFKKERDKWLEAIKVNEIKKQIPHLKDRALDKHSQLRRNSSYMSTLSQESDFSKTYEKCKFNDQVIEELQAQSLSQDCEMQAKDPSNVYEIYELNKKIKKKEEQQQQLTLQRKWSTAKLEELQAENIPYDQKMTDWGLSQTYEIHKWEEKRKESIRLENQLKEKKGFSPFMYYF